MWRAKVTILLGAVLFLLGCSEHNAVTPVASGTAAETSPPVAAVTPEVVVTVEVAPDGVTEDGYWNGGQWPDRPVYSIQHGISQTAHEHFRSCGVGDAQIEDLVRHHMERASNAVTLSSRIVVEGKGEPDATPTFTRVMDIERLVPGVYLVTCESR